MGEGVKKVAHFDIFISFDGTAVSALTTDNLFSDDKTEKLPMMTKSINNTCLLKGSVSIKHLNGKGAWKKICASDRHVDDDNKVAQLK